MNSLDLSSSGMRYILILCAVYSDADILLFYYHSSMGLSMDQNFEFEG